MNLGEQYKIDCCTTLTDFLLETKGKGVKSLMMKSFKSVGREMTKQQQQQPRSGNWVTVEYDDLKV